MSLTCVQKILNGLILASLVASPSAFAAKKVDSTKPTPSETVFEAPAAGVIQVSDYELNTFVFPEPVKNIHVAAGAPVNKPIYMANSTQVAIQFGKKTDKSIPSIQILFELESQATITLRVNPDHVPGILYTASPKASIKSTATISALKGKNGAISNIPRSLDPRSEDVDLLKSTIVSGEPPESFEPIPLPKPTSFDKFSVVPLNAWSNGAGKRIHSFSIVAAPGQTAVVAPTMFYREGISSIVLDGEVVDATNSPILFVVEDVLNEQ